MASAEKGSVNGIVIFQGYSILSLRTMSDTIPDQPPGVKCYMTIPLTDPFLVHRLLVSGINRPRDIQLNRNIFSTTISAPAGISDDDFIGKLIAANAAYPNNLPYAWFPTKKGKRYNSNGYASGILLYVTGSMPPRPPRTPGFKKPVPAQDF
jgi:hypothetical protein